MKNQCPVAQVLNFMGECGSELAKFLLKHGQYFTSQELPDEYPYDEQKMCFCNAANHAIGDESLTYVEGYAINMIPCMHAWCVDTGGNVIDTTWRNSEDCIYFGVPFDTKYLRRVLLERQYYGVIESPETDYALLRGNHGGPEKWMNKRFAPAARS